MTKLSKRRTRKLAEALLAVHQARDALRTALQHAPLAVGLHIRRLERLDAAAVTLAETLARLHPVDGEEAP